MCLLINAPLFIVPLSACSDMTWQTCSVFYLIIMWMSDAPQFLSYNTELNSEYAHDPHCTGAIHLHVLKKRSSFFVAVLIHRHIWTRMKIAFNIMNVLLISFKLLINLFGRYHPVGSLWNVMRPLLHHAHIIPLQMIIITIIMINTRYFYSA